MSSVNIEQLRGNRTYYLSDERMRAFAQLHAAIAVGRAMLAACAFSSDGKG